MPFANDVAAELRKLADSLDKEPDAVIENAWVQFYCVEREPFLATARLLPRPLKKKESWDHTKYELIYGDYETPIRIQCCVEKAKACTLIEPARPAVYDCLTILEQHEIDALEVEA